MFDWYLFAVEPSEEQVRHTCNIYYKLLTSMLLKACIIAAACYLLLDVCTLRVSFVVSKSARVSGQYCIALTSLHLPSVLWCCWLGGRKGIRPVKKTEWWGTGMVICLEWDADLHVAQLMPLLLTVSCFSKIQIGFTFLVPAHPGSPGKRAVKRVCVCVTSLHPAGW